MNTPPIFQISIPGNEISQRYRDLTLTSWEHYGYKVRELQAVTPETMPTEDALDFGNIRRRSFTDTEKAVFYSHFALWNYAAENDEDIIIIEHDCILQQELPQFKPRSITCFSFEVARLIPVPASGYFISAFVAKQLIEHVTSRKLRANVDFYVDGAVRVTEGLRRGKKWLTYKKFVEICAPWQCAIHYHNKLIGTTILHG